MRSRIAASVVLAAGVLLGSTGCAFFAPVATQIPYDPSDGVGTTVGDVEVRNAMAITADGDTVNLVVFVHNTGDKSAAVQFQYDFEGSADEAKSSETVTVPAGETVSFGNGGDTPDLILDNANTQLGALMPVFVQYGTETGKTILVPVLDGSLDGYGHLVPTNLATTEPEITATPVPTSTATSESTATPTETATPSETTTPTPAPTN
ncbi:MAG: hypothetical protein JWQ43_3235 [Glaciihabitans sp.]|nr:hypothetical protein [Glaciihabitans sp.]